MSAPSIWTTLDRGRYFLVPDDRPPEPGTLRITRLDGKAASASPDWLAPFEITEEHARRIARHQLGDALGEIRGSFDEQIADLRRRLDEFNRTPIRQGSTVTPDVASALLDLVKALPRAIGQSLSGDDGRLSEARETMAALQRRLGESGINVEDYLAKFADRLADLRKQAHPGVERGPKAK